VFAPAEWIKLDVGLPVSHRPAQAQRPAARAKRWEWARSPLEEGKGDMQASQLG